MQHEGISRRYQLHGLSADEREKGIGPDQRIIPIAYGTSRVIVKKAGEMVDVRLRPHDLRRHAATYASRAGTPLEIVSKVSAALKSANDSMISGKGERR